MEGGNATENKWDNIIAATYIFIAVLLWSVSNMFIKYTAIQLSGCLFIVNLVSAACSLAYWYIGRPMPGRSFLGDTKHERATLLSFALVQSSYFSLYYAIDRLPLGDLSCINMLGPLLIILFSWLLFRDVLPPWYLTLPAAVSVVSGVIMVTQPTFLFSTGTSLHWDGVLAACINALRFAIKTMIVKAGGNTLHGVQYQFVSNIACIAIAVPLLLILNSFILQNSWIGTFDDFLEMHWTMWLLSCYIGVTFFIGLVVDMMAYQRGNATLIASMEYLDIPYCYLFQVYVFEQVPNAIEGVGASLTVIGSLAPALDELVMILLERKRTEGTHQAEGYQPLQDHSAGQYHTSPLQGYSSLESV